MTLFAALEFAREGVAVRRAGWTAGDFMRFEGGNGTSKAVAVIVASGVKRVVQLADIASAEFAASDWSLL